LSFSLSLCLGLCLALSLCISFCLSLGREGVFVSKLLRESASGADF
jgi:H+/Cl- antiporter ClcA